MLDYDWEGTHYRNSHNAYVEFKGVCPSLKLVPYVVLTAHAGSLVICGKNRCSSRQRTIPTFWLSEPANDCKYSPMMILEVKQRFRRLTERRFLRQALDRLFDKLRMTRKP